MSMGFEKSGRNLTWILRKKGRLLFREKILLCTFMEKWDFSANV